MDINAVIVGERQVIARFDQLSLEIHELLHERIAVLTAELEGRVRAETPVGKTGHLQGSVKSTVRDYPQKIVGRVLSTAPYASVIEFGIHKMESVRAHEQRLSHAWSNDISPIEVSVDPYTRMANVEARLFMRAGLRSMEGEITEALRALMEGASASV